MVAIAVHSLYRVNAFQLKTPCLTYSRPFWVVKSVYWSSRLVTLGLLSLRLLLAEELLWGKVAHGLVRTHCVIGKLPKAELLVQGCDLQGKVFDLIELLGMGTLCPFHRTIELGRARWQYEEAKASLLTRLLKARLETRSLRPPV